MTDQGAHEAQSSADLLELRVSVSALAAGVEQLRQALIPLAGMPHQLDALQALHSERLTNHIANHVRDVKDLHDDLEAEEGRRRAGDKDLEARLTKAIEAIQEWQTWAIRIVLAFVILAVLGLVVVTP